MERTIEGTWFTAVVEEFDARHETVRLKYLDDGNVEDNVHLSEIRLCATAAADGKDDGGSRVEDCKQSRRKETLPKPLAGLVEDDSELRRNHQATVVVHASTDTEEAIIINGAENKVAAGAGLRALRYLKH